MTSEVEGEVTTPGDVLQLTIYPTKISVKTEKSYKEKTIEAIVRNITSLLNSRGGRLVLTYVKNPPKNHILDCVRIIEQRVQEMTGSAKMVSKIKRNVYPNRIDFLVKPSASLVTMNYNLYLPTKTQVIPVRATDAIEEVKEILGGRKINVRQSLESQNRKFVKCRQVAFEEDSNVQFKNLKSAPGKRVTLADRIVSNKLAHYVSAFANHDGGVVYYGISDDGVVQGETIIDHRGKSAITRKVTKAINEMIWCDQNSAPKRGQGWNIAFEPVQDEKGKPIPKLYVIMVEVSSHPGGVFVHEPESYHIVEGKVEKMNFKTWKSTVMSGNSFAEGESFQEFIEHRIEGHEEQCAEIPHCEAVTSTGDSNSVIRKDITVSKHAIQPATVCHTSSNFSSIHSSHIPMYCWSSKRNRDIFICFTGKFLNLRNNYDMKGFDKFSRLAGKKFPKSDVGLIVKAERVAIAYKNHNFQKANSLLKELMSECQTARDRRIYEVRILYLRSRIERAAENFEKSFEIANACLQQLQLIPPGFLSVWSYMNAAFVAGVLSCRESDLKKRDHLKMKERKYLEWAQRDVDTLDDFPETMDLREKLHIYRAMSYLGCPFTGEVIEFRCSAEDLTNARYHLREVHGFVLEGHVLTRFRNIQFLLARSDLFRRQRMVHGNDEVQNFEQSFRLVEEAKRLARKHHFEEIVSYSNKRLADMTEAILRLEVRRVGKRDSDDELLKEIGIDDSDEIHEEY